MEKHEREISAVPERNKTMSITIKPVHFTENGFMTQPFALGDKSAKEALV